jgi:hypothetical protein
MEASPSGIDSWIEAASTAASLTIEQHQQPGVRAHLEAARRLALLLAAVPLPPETENAPVFQP